jgi:tetratricopeptide (TPR) repeat protein
MSQEIEDVVERAMKAQRERRLVDARSACIELVELSRQLEDQPQLARALRLLGEAERKLHDAAAARLHYEEAVTLYRQLDDPLGFAHTIRHLGDVYHDSGLPELALPCYREALEVYRAQAKAAPLDLANAIRSLAVLRSEMQARDEARVLWEEARGLYQSVGVEAGVAESNARLVGLKAASSNQI